MTASTIDDPNMFFENSSVNSETSVMYTKKLSASAFEACDVSKFGDSDIKNLSPSLVLRRWTTSLSICDISHGNLDVIRDSSTIASPTCRKNTPLLSNPPGLVRRFADCDLTGDNHYTDLKLFPEDKREILLESVSLEPYENGLKGDAEKMNSGEEGKVLRLFHILKENMQKNFKLKKSCSAISNAEYVDASQTSDCSKSCTEAKVTSSSPARGINFRPISDLFHLFENVKERLLLRRQAFQIDEPSTSLNF